MITESKMAEHIAVLEERRYRAMIDGDLNALEELCSVELTYTHSAGDQDDRLSYLNKVRSGHFVYHEIEHPADRIRLFGDAALVTGRMTARVSVAGSEQRINNAYLAVWAIEREAWRFVAYQPTPLPT
jgi:hypothetical protein